jgi:hypothetical protein
MELAVLRGNSTPTKKTIERAREDARKGKAATTQAGEFVREEMEHANEGRHSTNNPKQAIAIGLSKARRAGVKLAPPAKGKTSAATRQKAQRDVERAKTGAAAKPSPKRSAARLKALQQEPRAAASHLALSRQAKKAARARKAS